MSDKKSFKEQMKDPEQRKQYVQDMSMFTMGSAGGGSKAAGKALKKVAKKIRRKPKVSATEKKINQLEELIDMEGTKDVPNERYMDKLSNELIRLASKESSKIKTPPVGATGPEHPEWGYPGVDFQQGGYLQGPSHKKGGIPAVIAGQEPVELEGGEYIIKKSTVDAVG